MPDYKSCDIVLKFNLGVDAILCADMELVVDMLMLRNSVRSYAWFVLPRQCEVSRPAAYSCCISELFIWSTTSSQLKSRHLLVLLT